LTSCLLAPKPIGLHARRYSMLNYRKTGLSLLRVAFSTLAIRSRSGALLPLSPYQSQSLRIGLWFYCTVDYGHNR
jgi:hypothetical protein